MCDLVIVQDTRQHKGHHEQKLAAWAAHGDTIVSCALAAGDYALPPAVAVDTKASMSEIAQNIGGTAAEHGRFRRELIKARDMGTHLYVLVENADGIRSIDEVRGWVNPRLALSPKAITGERLAKAMQTMQDRYGVTFLFCRPEESAIIIYKLLERGK